MLRFYAKRIDDKYIVMSDPNNLIKKEYTQEELFNETASFCEIKIAFNYSFPKVLFVQGYDRVNPEAIKASNEHNTYLLSGELKHSEKPTVQEMREQFQEVIDRIGIYGNEFNDAFNSFLSTYPIQVKNINSYYRQVQKI